MSHHESFHPRPRIDSNLADTMTDIIAAREFAHLPEPRVTARMIVVNLLMSACTVDLKAMAAVLERIGRIARGEEAPESAADRVPIRTMDGEGAPLEDFLTTRVKRPKA